MTILDQIIAHKRREVERLSIPLGCGRAPGGFGAKLRGRGKVPVVIAEIKRASPSKGPIALDLDPVGVATDYLKNGAAALSILTDSEFFKGSAADLKAVRAAFPDAAILRKDFIIDLRQVEETAALGADAILLILAALRDDELHSLAHESWRIGLDILFEVHDESEVDRVAPLLEQAPGSDRALFGVNNRDLKTFNVEIKTTGRCIKRLRSSGRGQDVICVAESGIRSQEDILQLRSDGAGAFLIGESLIRSGNPGEQLANLLKKG